MKSLRPSAHSWLGSPAHSMVAESSKVETPSMRALRCLLAATIIKATRTEATSATAAVDPLAPRCAAPTRLASGSATRWSVLRSAAWQECQKGSPPSRGQPGAS
eukprot:scaffold34036_cov28-Tisochrysis_lutea.AAC.3